MTCSVRGCSLEPVRRCLSCGRQLCTECFCVDHEVIGPPYDRPEVVGPRAGWIMPREKTRR